MGRAFFFFFSFQSISQIKVNEVQYLLFFLFFFLKKQLFLNKGIKSILMTFKSKFNWTILPFRNFNNFKFNGQLNIYLI